MRVLETPAVGVVARFLAMSVAVRRLVIVGMVMVVGMIVRVCVIMSMLMVSMSVFALMRVRAETRFGVRLRGLMRVPWSRHHAL
jgi:hypothetical protein